MRAVVDQWQLVGASFTDPVNWLRSWQVYGIYAPVNDEGLRAKVVDPWGYTAFVRQLELEVLLGRSRPGDWCDWANREYPLPGTRAWGGLRVTEEDAIDDLFDRECYLRQFNPAGLPAGLEIKRLLHNGSADVEELLVLLRDWDLETGRSPDPFFETIEHRWVPIERNKIYV